MTNCKYSDPFDILIIGGGVNGCGVARDAAGRGYSVCLVEMADLANGTSSGSTKLIHGGLRYLEYYQFRLVRESLKERELLWSMAPHIIWPIKFVLPHNKELRPFWMIKLGLWLYDNIGGRKLLAPSSLIKNSQHETLRPLVSEFKKAFEYSDCWVDDARLVVLNACDAKAKGAEILTRTKVLGAKRKGSWWEVNIQAHGSKKITTVKARALINAGGPWVSEISERLVSNQAKTRLRLVKGSHIVVPQLFDHGRSYIFQNADQRITFAIPYEGKFTLIGTTDVDYQGDPDNCTIDKQEIDYLCQAANRYFKQKLSAKDVVWHYAAIRPLVYEGKSKAQAATRDYLLRVEHPLGQAPLIDICGGKITTYRKLAQKVLQKIDRAFNKKTAVWTNRSPLPGGDFPPQGFDQQLTSLLEQYNFLKKDLAKRLLRLYGTKAKLLLAEAKSYADLGQHFGADLYAQEVDYLRDYEWAMNAEDVLWRRTKLGLLFNDSATKKLDSYLKTNV